MDRALLLASISAAIMIFGHIAYMRTIVEGTTVPNKATWLIVTFTSWVIIANQIASGVNDAIYGMVAMNFTITAIFLLSLKYGISSVSKFDPAVVVIALLGLLVWFVLEDPTASVIASAIGGFVSLLPTFNKLRTHPGTENSTTWFLGSVSMVFMAFAVDPEFDFLLLPVLWIFLNSIVGVLNLRKPETVAAE